MSTVAVYNGYGRYEENEHGKKGITLTYAGDPFFLEYDAITYLPDYTLREVDHDKSTPDGESEGELVYKTIRISGERLSEELLETQVPVKNREKGIVVIPSLPRKRGRDVIRVPAGFEIDGARLFAEVITVNPDPEELEVAKQAARTYKMQIVQEYLQSKRERMAGGQGRFFPNGIVKIFMDELGVKDIDDITRQTDQKDSIERLADVLVQRMAPNTAQPQTAEPIPPAGQVKTSSGVDISDLV